MTKALTNYDKIKISTAHVFLQYNQATMIHKYSLNHNSHWLYITFINRTYRINRKTGSVQWSDNDFEIIRKVLKLAKHPLIAEGNIDTPEKAKRVIELGAYSVVVGSIITRPQIITRSFVNALELDN